jgi:hypothetical protein
MRSEAAAQVLNCWQTAADPKQTLAELELALDEWHLLKKNRAASAIKRTSEQLLTAYRDLLWILGRRIFRD